jgi:hypothetical protein
MTAQRCQLHKYDDKGNCAECGGLAVVKWKSRDGDLFICEQDEAMVIDCAKGGSMAAVFEPLPA